MTTRCGPCGRVAAPLAWVVVSLAKCSRGANRGYQHGLVVVALLTALLPSVGFARGARHRWPRWPTEFDQVVAPLRAEVTKDGDHERVEALLALDAYASELIEPWLLGALGDPSAAVKREALRICFERELVACVPSALAIWSSVTEPMLRVAALRVVGLDPAGAGLDALLVALRDDSDTMRAQAAVVLGTAALHGPSRNRATVALLAKLGDLSAIVRQTAVESLGALGSHDATLPVARLLDDAEPMVRLAAARALGQLGDPRGVAALIRSLEAINEAAVVRTIVAALAILPGDAAAEVLLAAFDEPPTGITTADVADLLGLRPNPEPKAIEGLATRLRDPASARLALRALANLGELGTAALQRELERGASPDLTLELERVLAGLRVRAQVPERRETLATPAPRTTVDGLARRRAVAPGEALAEIDGLAATRNWGPQLDAIFIAARVASEHRVELALAAAQGPSARLGRWDRRSVATLVGWATNRANTSTDRCLALLALGSVEPGTKPARSALAAAQSLLRDADPRVRACAAVPWHALQNRHDELALHDPDPRVRVVAILMAAKRGPSRAERARIALLETTDDDAHVRVAARWANGVVDRRAGSTWLHGGTLDPSGRWMRVRVGRDAQLWIPALRVGGVPYAWVPQLRGVVADPEI